MKNVVFFGTYSKSRGSRSHSLPGHFLSLHSLFHWRNKFKLMVLVMIAGQIDGINGKGFIGWAPVISSTQSPVGALPSPWLHWFSLISSLSLEEKDSNALCCYPNVNGAIRNLSLNTPTATIFLQFNYFRGNIWVRIWVQFHFLYIFVGRVDRIR